MPNGVGVLFKGKGNIGVGKNTAGECRGPQTGCEAPKKPSNCPIFWRAPQRKKENPPPPPNEASHSDRQLGVHRAGICFESESSSRQAEF